jgi:hypothetical protein
VVPGGQHRKKKEARCFQRMKCLSLFAAEKIPLDNVPSRYTRHFLPALNTTLGWSEQQGGLILLCLRMDSPRPNRGIFHRAVQGIELIFNTTELAIYATEWTVGCQFCRPCGLIDSPGRSVNYVPDF